MEKPKRCFIIGPMKDMDRLLKLKNEVIKPLLAPHQFEVTTPEEGEHENIMRQVLLNLEQADILIADISGNNPNVMYELGIYHSFGKPYITLNDRSYKRKGGGTPFDIASYRYVDIDLGNIEYSQKMLKPRLESIMANIEVLDYFGNPVTDFYKSPVAEIPTAVGLSKNYTRNFLGLLLPDVFLKAEGSNDFALEICAENTSVNDVYHKLNYNERSALKFEIAVPTKLYMSDHSYISELKSIKKDFLFKKAKVIKRSREFNLHIRTGENGEPILTDFPTVLSTLNESINRRRKEHTSMIGAEQWEVLEQQELERFKRKCELFFAELEQRSPVCKGRLKVSWIEL